MNPLIVIPARGGSKGIPNKNIKLLGGKPLIQYTIEVATELFPKESILLSTDSDEIIELSEKLGLPVKFKRPDVLSSDTASSYEVIKHAISEATALGINFDCVILLQPTSPFRTSDHVKEAMKLFSNDIDMVVSVTTADENPYYSLFEEDNQGLLKKSKSGNFTRRQDCPNVYKYNGAIYIMNLNSLHESNLSNFKKIRKFEMNSATSIDLDTPLDWKFAELLISEGNL